MSSDLMDTEAGGESTQYESIHTVTKPHAKQDGQLSGSETNMNASSDVQSQQKAGRGAKTAENVRYGQATSEQGVGGMTSTSDGEANAETGYGGTGAQMEDINAEETRQAQGYGSGSSIGA